MKRYVWAVWVFLLLQAGTVFAFSQDVVITPENVSLTRSTILEGQALRIYAHVWSLGTEDAKGMVHFEHVEDGQIGGDQPISVVSGKVDTVFVDFVPKRPGEQQIRVSILPAEPGNDDPNNNVAVKIIVVHQDTDRDGVMNSADSDDDNDGVSDSEDLFPLNRLESRDTDGDGIGDNADSNDDNDGAPDSDDAFPLDPAESADIDGDLIGDNSDDDIDGDGLPNAQELGGGTGAGAQNGGGGSGGGSGGNGASGGGQTSGGGGILTDPRNPDTDNDGVNDGGDAFPTDPSESADFDDDGLGDNADTDDDNDTIPDSEDSFPKNKGPIVLLPTAPKTGLPGNKLTFDATPSFDEDGEITDFRWRIGDRPLEEGREGLLEYTFNLPGDYQVSLITRDNSGEERAQTFTVRIFDTYPGLITALLLTVILLAIVLYFQYSGRATRSERKRT